MIERDEYDSFGKCIADQLRSLPVDVAVMLQGRIHGMITEERLKRFQTDSFSPVRDDEGASYEDAMVEATKMP